MINYGKHLRKYREANKVSQTMLARRMGKRNASYISRRESGAIKMSRREYADAVAVIEAIVENRNRATDPTTVLEVN